ncbi:hypothetical protein RSAG8_09587, partial [Rhizoctonia solani AG-8 WAC10335]
MVSTQDPTPMSDLTYCFQLGSILGSVQWFGSVSGPPRPTYKTGSYAAALTIASFAPKPIPIGTFWSTPLSWRH